MADIDLGFAEERDSVWLTNRYFPCKVGGAPAWLELEVLPRKEQLTCSKCTRPKTFLCQLYAPFDDDHNFHRSVYLFVCRTPSCQAPNESDCFTVLRSQLPRENPYFAFEAPDEEGESLPDIPTLKKLCYACGSPGPLACSRCKCINYCSPIHQRAHWPEHKTVCKPTGAVPDTAPLPASQSAAVFALVRFPECEIVIEPNDPELIEKPDEDDDEDDTEADKERQRLADFEQLAAAGRTGALSEVPASELDKFAQGAEAMDDRHFRQFKRALGAHPEQIVRYKRGGEPLWIANVEQTVAPQLNVPKCGVCGGARQFEFQLMPQLLMQLKEEHVDWGVLVVYTCINSCPLPAGVGYVEEYLVKQDIAGAASV